MRFVVTLPLGSVEVGDVLDIATLDKNQKNRKA